uniref:Ribosome-binding factor A n=1 Tax=Rhodosorus marinus TaxID=101924 RepID=A0A7S3A657_9RHOD|mmetsp:Transcript_45159/g.175213  ORF Transcript_45159/g.175213 Transcript_45159/m.175213 type:complete len:202 (+) Transcript_45159:502-1107(+)
MDGVGFVVFGGGFAGLGSNGSTCTAKRGTVVCQAGRRGGRSRKFEGGLKDDRGGRRRPTRVGELYRRELSLIVREMVANAPRSAGLGSALISVLDVDVSPDLRNATVKVSIFKTEDQKSDALGYLKGRRKAIKGILSQNFREMKRVPELRFVEADVASGFRTLELLNGMSEQRSSSTADPPLGLSVEDDDDDVVFYDEAEK